MRARLLMLASLALTACGDQGKPETLVDRLRVLAITSSPAEVKPGESTTLEVLQLDPSRPGQITTTVWVGCEPDPFNLGRSACNDTTALLQPTKFATFPPGVRILGFGTKTNYACASNLFDVLEPNDPIRQNGTVGQVLAVVIGQEINPTSSDEELRELFHKIETQEVQSLFALTRVLVTERTAPNQTPHLDGFYQDGVGVPANATLQLDPGQHVRLRVTAPGADRETYSLVLPDLSREEKTESLIATWYSTAGRFSLARVDLDTGAETEFIAPGSSEVPDDPVPDKRSGSLWAVLRDNRGGQSYEPFRFFVCDRGLPAPKVKSVTVPANPMDPVLISGDNMSSALDVLIGGVALKNGSYSQARQVFVGENPQLPSGSYPITVRGKECSSQDAGLTYTVP